MKKALFSALVALLLCSSCSVTFQNAIMNHNYSTDNIDLRSQTENYRVVGTVTGHASATYIFTIGGLSEDAKRIFASSYNDMVANARLKSNQAIINVVTEKRTNLFFYPIFSRQIVHTTGTIIEFIGEMPSSQYKPREEVKTSVKKDNAFSLHETYTNKAVIVELDANGIHGKAAIRTFNTLCSYETACMQCRELGGGWRLPTRSELLTILNNKKSINVTLESIGAECIDELSYYWYHSINPAVIDAKTLEALPQVGENTACSYIAILDL